MLCFHLLLSSEGEVVYEMLLPSWSVCGWEEAYADSKNVHV